MSNTKFAEPTQNVVASSYFQKKFEFEIDDVVAEEPVRSCRYLNQILRIFANDSVITGSGVLNVSLDGNELSVKINDGKIIQDSTLVKFPSFTLGLDVSSFIGDASKYKAIVFTKFRYSPVSRDVLSDPNSFTFRLGIFDTSTGDVYQSNTIVYPWDTDKNRVIITILPLDNLNLDHQENEITIDGITYNRFGDYTNSILAFNYDGGVI